MVNETRDSSLKFLLTISPNSETTKECPSDLTVVLVKYIYRLTEASCLGYEEMHKPGDGGIPLYKQYRYVPPQRVGLLGLFGLKTGMDFRGQASKEKHTFPKSLPFLSWSSWSSHALITISTVTFIIVINIIIIIIIIIISSSSSKMTMTRMMMNE